MPCEEITVQDNWILHGTKEDSYHCSHVTSFQEKGNSPPGLGECLYNSINHTNAGTITDDQEAITTARATH